MIAADEAERYKAQADAMRGQLKRVIDEGTLTVEAIMEPRVYGPQFDVTYSYVTPKLELKGKSSAASDKWTLNGKGSQAGKIKKAKIAGMTCKPSGQLNDTVTMAFDTDGLTMSLDKRPAASGDIYIKCGAASAVDAAEERRRRRPVRAIELKNERARVLATLEFAR